MVSIVQLCFSNFLQAAYFIETYVCVCLLVFNIIPPNFNLVKSMNNPGHAMRINV